MPSPEIFFVLVLIYQLGITLAVGSSTFALIFYYLGISDGEIDSSERRFLHAVYFVLRIGMAICIPLELWSFFILGGLASGEAAPLAKVLLLGIIVLNAILMQVKKMPLWLGPALAGGSWYSYFFLNSIPLGGVSFSSIVLSYIIFLVFLILFLRYLRIWLQKRHLSRLQVEKGEI